MKILVIKLSAIGDVVQTLPALEAIKKTYPESTITWIVEEAAAGILEGHPLIDRLLVSHRKAWIKMLKNPETFMYGLRGIRGFIRSLRDTHYDIAIDFQGLLKSGILIGLARAKRKIGFDGTRELSYLFLNERLPKYDIEKHALERYLDVARYLGAKDPSPTCTLPIEREISAVKERLARIVRSEEFGVRGEAIRRGDMGEAETGGRGDRETGGRGDAETCRQGGGTESQAKYTRPMLVVINPVARWKTKLWSEEKFAELADRLINQRKATVVFTGSADDRPVTSRIVGMMKENAEDWAGRTTLKELAALARLSDIFITTDTGPMHLAAAAGAHVLALFGPTAPWRTGPYGDGHIVVRAGIECSPCFKRRCSHVRCMEGITVEAVFKEIENMVKS